MDFNKNLKLAFSDGGQFCQTLISSMLSNDYEITIDQQNPDILIYSMFGRQHREFNCKKICIIGENCFPDFNECDYAISPHYIKFDRHLRIPFYAFNKEYQQLLDNDISKVDNPEQRQLCGAMVSNSMTADPRRAQFMHKLIERKLVCSAGNALNNIGCKAQQRPNFAENQPGRYTNLPKIQFSRLFKFNLALENSIVDGYHTEKITDVFASYSVPVYWGSPSISCEFDSHSFINVLDFKSFDDAIDYMQAMPDQKYLEMLDFEEKLLCKDYLHQLRDFLVYAVNGSVFNHSYGYMAFTNYNAKHLDITQ